MRLYPKEVPSQEPRSQPKPATLSCGQAAALLRVHARSVARWCALGRLPAKRTAGGHWRIPRGALADYIE